MKQRDSVHRVRHGARERDTGPDDPYGSDRPDVRGSPADRTLDDAYPPSSHWPAHGYGDRPGAGSGRWNDPYDPSNPGRGDRSGPTQAGGHGGTSYPEHRQFRTRHPGTGYGDPRAAYGSGIDHADAYDAEDDPWNKHHGLGREGVASDPWNRSHHGPSVYDDPYPGSSQGLGYSGLRRLHEREFDSDYQQWRAEQMRALDEDYRSWRQDRYKKFADEFHQWRSSRARPADSGTETSSTSASESDEKKER